MSIQFRSPLTQINCFHRKYFSLSIPRLYRSTPRIFTPFSDNSNFYVFVLYIFENTQKRTFIAKTMLIQFSEDIENTISYRMMKTTCSYISYTFITQFIYTFYITGNVHIYIYIC